MALPPVAHFVSPCGSNHKILCSCVQEAMQSFASSCTASVITALKRGTGNNVTSITTTIPIHVGDTTETGALTDDITWSFRPAANTLSIDGEIPEGHKVLIACYDENGMLTKLEVLTISGSVKLPDSARIRVFYIDGDSKPLCAAATVLE